MIITSYGVPATTTHSSSALRTSPQIPLRNLRARADVEVEDINRQAHRRARVGDVHNAGNVALHGCAREQEVDLIVVVACTMSAKLCRCMSESSLGAHHIVSDTRCSADSSGGTPP